MVYKKIIIPSISLLVLTLCSLSQAENYRPSTEPIFKTPQPKSNIMLVLDDSTSMRHKDVYMIEHAYGPGQPECYVDGYAVSWGKEQEEQGYYNPFPKKWSYAPWNDENADEDSMINGKSEPPAYPYCVKVSRADALKYVLDEVLNKYRDKAYIGANVINHVGSIPNKMPDGTESLGLVTLPLEDYSKHTQEDFDIALAPIKQALDDRSGKTPTALGLYHALKIFRGGPVDIKNADTYAGSGDDKYYDYAQYNTPLRYRCQQNHIVNMSDGKSEGTYVYGVFEADSHLPYYSGRKYTTKIVNGVDLNKWAWFSKDHQAIGELSASLDLRDAVKPLWNPKTQSWENKDIDDAGKPWNDPIFSKTMPVIMNNVTLTVKPNSKAFLNLVNPSGGKSIGFFEDEGGSTTYTADDLLSGFDTIFSDIVQSGSSMGGVNDKIYSDILPHKVEMKYGRLYLDDKLTDMSKLGTIRYTTKYGFAQRYGILSAVIPYIESYETLPDGKRRPNIKTYELWNTSSRITYGQSRFVTYLKKDQQMGYSNDAPGIWIYRIHNLYARTNFKNLYKELYGHTDYVWHERIHWMYKFTNKSFWYNLRPRMTPMGSITSQDIRLANKDILNINIAKHKTSPKLRQDLTNWLRFKANFQPQNFIVVADNDGFINFINAQRGLDYRNKYNGGHRDTAYFPQILYHRFDEIAKKNQKPTFIIDGRTNLVDAKVWQEGWGTLYATIGLTGLGAGGKGLVGYRIYATKEETLKEWLTKGRKPSRGGHQNSIDKVTPIFEITNEGPKKWRTKGFENLGYANSGFEFFNRIIHKNGQEQGQLVAVFGNGFGTKKSTLFFIDAYTGEKLQEVILSHDGGGAATPSIIVKNATDNSGQQIQKIYVGDYSGTLYQIDIMNGDFTNDHNVYVTALFQAPKTNPGQSAISTKPMVIKTKNGKMNILFGTGIAKSDTVDRGQNAAVQHNIYNIQLSPHLLPGYARSADITKNTSYLTLERMFNINDLNSGYVKYTKEMEIDYLQPNHFQVDIKAPTLTIDSNHAAGWYIELTADGRTSGERVIEDPRYDQSNETAIFNTWGIRERESNNDQGLYDPCLRDASFGKTLVFKVETGEAGSAGGRGPAGGNNDESDNDPVHDNLGNTATIGSATGSITGDLISTASPDDNSITALADLDVEVVEEVIAATGVDNSSYTTIDENGFKSLCQTSDTGETICIRVERETKTPRKGRVSFHSLFESF